MEHVPDHLLANICYMLPSMAGIAMVNLRFASIARNIGNSYVAAMGAQGKTITLAKFRPSPRVCCIVTGVDIPKALLAPIRRCKPRIVDDLGQGGDDVFEWRFKDCFHSCPSPL